MVTNLPHRHSSNPTVEASSLDLFLPTLKVISYRGPGHSGGVSTSLEPIVRRLGTKVHWFALSHIPNEVNATEKFAPFKGDAFSFHVPKVEPSLIEKHGKTTADYLWPLFHGMPEKATFDIDNWKSFRNLNELVASECLRVSPESIPTLCWLHDYQLMLVAPLLSIQAGLILCHFWHIPWPKPAAIVSSPVAKELVEAMLSNRVIGFHTSEYAKNFLQTAAELFPNAVVDMTLMEVHRRRNSTKVVVMPLGIDFNLWKHLAEESKTLFPDQKTRFELAEKVVVGADRIDYTKGLLEKLSGLEAFLDTHKDMRGKFSYVQLCQPLAPTDGPALHAYANQVRARINHLNEKYAQGSWQPIHHLVGQLDQVELASWFRTADVLAVNSVRDGLNLVAKEFVATREDNKGTLILSKQAGSATELGGGALLVDPLRPGEFAEALNTALTMDEAEVTTRMSSMRQAVGFNQLHDWALGFLRQALR